MRTRGRSAALGTLVLILCVSAAWLLTAAAESERDLTGRTEVSIILTSQGFDPQTTYITQGGRVSFASEIDRIFWPASDLHPFHRIYGEFDPKRPLMANESWSFVFAREGRWDFHDHIDPAVTGTIIVLPKGMRAYQYDDSTDDCTSGRVDERRSCWKRRLAFSLEDKGLAAAFQELEAVYTSHKEFAEECHLYAHDLGLLAYQHYSERIPFLPQMAACGQGFFHGYMEGFLSGNDGDVHAARAFCERLGEHFGESFELAGPQCFHGIGHGQMEYLLSTRIDLIRELPRLIGLGIEDCAVLADDDGRFRCASGVYAVTKDWINIQDLTDELAVFFSLDDIYALCRNESEDWAQRACAWEMSKQAYLMNKGNVARTFAAQVASARPWMPELLPSMITSSSFFIGEFGISRNDDELARACDFFSDALLRGSCIEGIVLGLLFNAHPGREVERPARFCAAEALADEEQNACIRSILLHMLEARGLAAFKDACVFLESGESLPLCRESTHCTTVACVLQSEHE